jgi:hypothetical protein
MSAEAADRYSEPLPVESLCRPWRKMRPQAKSEAVQQFLCRHSRKLENSHQENYYHAVLHLNSPVRVYIPRIPPRPRPTQYGLPKSPRWPGRAERASTTVKRASDNTSTTLLTTMPPTIRLEMCQQQIGETARMFDPLFDEKLGSYTPGDTDDIGDYDDTLDDD